MATAYFTIRLAAVRPLLDSNREHYVSLSSLAGSYATHYFSTGSSPVTAMLPAPSPPSAAFTSTAAAATTINVTLLRLVFIIIHIMAGGTDV